MLPQRPKNLTHAVVRCSGGSWCPSSWPACSGSASWRPSSATRATSDSSSSRRRSTSDDIRTAGHLACGSHKPTVCETLRGACRRSVLQAKHAARSEAAYVSCRALLRLPSSCRAFAVWVDRSVCYAQRRTKQSIMSLSFLSLSESVFGASSGSLRRLGVARCSLFDLQTL